MSVGIHEHESVVAERDALRREVERLRSEGDKLDAPAVVGYARFGKGVSWRAVIMAAQRRYQETVTPESEAARLEKAAETNLIVALRDAEIARLNADLAASQAREQQLREALEACEKILFHYDRFSDDVEAHEKAVTALAIPSDTTALQAMITKAGEVMRERCADYCETLAGYEAADEKEWASRIRALPTITLDDLKGGA